MLNKISFRIIFFFPGEMISHQLHTNLGIWFHWDTVYRVIFVTCYFHPSSLAYSFALTWIRPDKVVFKEKQYEYCSSSSPKFAPWQWGVKGAKIKRVNISLYAVTGHLKTWWLCMKKKEDVKMKYMYAIS